MIIAERYELTFEVSREDWIAVNMVHMRDGEAWRDAENAYRRNQRKQVLWFAPICIAGGALLLGRGTSTHGGYLPGAALGACFAAFLYWALPRVNAVEKQKARQMDNLRKQDLSMFCGTTSVVAEASGVHIKTPTRELKLTWEMVGPARTGDYIMLGFGGGDGAIVPRRAFASDTEFEEFLTRANEWRAAQLSSAARLERYLKDRDVTCPGCRYNLHGLKGETCPECGVGLSVEGLGGGVRNR